MTNKKILITDDDPCNVMLLETLLQSYGYQTRKAMSGQAALDQIATEQPDLILLDLMMPGMDGFEVVRRLKANPDTANIPIIMVTALDDEGSRGRLAAAGVSEVIHKPLDRWELQASIAKLLVPPDGDE